MKKINKIRIKNISKKKSEDILNQLLVTLVAEGRVNPESIKFLSDRLTRPVNQEKEDTREYNNSFVSKLDLATLNFMEAGVKNDFFPGEGVLITAWLQKHIEKNPELADYVVEVMKDKFNQIDHMKDPILRFCAPVSYDIGAKYILRTEQMDTFLSVFSEIEENRGKFISDSDWSLILSAVKKADNRITSEDIIFLSPIEEGITGNHRQLSTEEKERFGFGDKKSLMDADFRKDEHDLVALKELAYVMKGNSVDDLSPFAGAFLKYMPELNELGIRAIVFEVVDNILKSVKISKFEGKSVIPYGPAEAAVALAQCFPELESVKDFKANTRYYVTVSGFVCSPDDIKHFGYSEMTPKLNNAIPAGETIMFQAIGDLKYSGIPHPSAVRLYFYPFKPSQLHPIYQKMTALYGQSDNMFHSCAYDPKHIFYSDQYSEKFSRDVSANMFNDQPSARYVYNDIKKSNPFIPPGAIFSKAAEYKKMFGTLGEEVSNSMYGENIYTAQKYLEFASKLSGFPSDEAKKVLSLECLDFTRCLPSAFMFFNYTQNEHGGLISTTVATTIRKSLSSYDYKRVSGNLTENMAATADLSNALEDMKKGKDILVVMKEFWNKLDKRK